MSLHRAGLLVVSLLSVVAPAADDDMQIRAAKDAQTERKRLVLAISTAEAHLKLNETAEAVRVVREVAKTVWPNRDSKQNAEERARVSEMLVKYDEEFAARQKASKVLDSRAQELKAKSPKSAARMLDFTKLVLTGDAQMERVDEKLNIDNSDWPTLWGCKEAHQRWDRKGPGAFRREGTAGRDACWVTHPVSKDSPVKWTRKVQLPESPEAKLVLDVAASKQFDAEGKPADWLLVVIVNEQELTNTVVSKNIWRQLEFDLAAYAGKEITIELVNEFGGRNALFGEAGFWDNIRIVKK